jgi:hypothetical protein
MTEEEIKKEQDKLLVYLKDKYPNKDIDVTRFFKDIRAKYGVSDIYTIQQVYSKIEIYVEFPNLYSGLQYVEVYNSDNTKVFAHLKAEGFNYLSNRENLDLTIQLAKSNLDTNKSIKSLGKHQKVNMWIIGVLTIVVTTLALIVQYKQYVRENGQDELKDTFQKDLMQTQLQIQSLKTSLDSMRVLHSLDNNVKKK